MANPGRSRSDAGRIPRRGLLLLDSLSGMDRRRPVADSRSPVLAAVRKEVAAAVSAKQAGDDSVLLYQAGELPGAERWIRPEPKGTASGVLILRFDVHQHVAMMNKLAAARHHLQNFS